MAPVRRAAAQLLGVASRHLPLSDVKFVVESLASLSEEQEWHIRHGVGLAMCAVLTVRVCVCVSVRMLWGPGGGD